MRVFLKVGKTLQKPGGGEISWPAQAFCEVDEQLGESWVKAGDAQRATLENKILEEEPTPEPKSVAARSRGKGK